MKAILKYTYNLLKTKQGYSEATWSYLKEKGLRPDKVRDLIEDESVSKYKGFVMYISQRQQCELFEYMLKFANAKNCLEIGVFTGSSAMSIARGIGPGGKLVALELNEEYAKDARKFLEMAGVADRVEIMLGPASESLKKIRDQGKVNFFDFAYIDADKPGYVDYYNHVLPLMRIGGLIAFDNVLYANSVSDKTNTSENTVAIRKINDVLIKDDRISNFILPIGDGVNLAIRVK